MKKKLFLSGFLVLLMLMLASCYVGGDSVGDADFSDGETVTVEDTSTDNNGSSTEDDPTEDNGKEDVIVFSVTFDSNGGTAVSSISVEAGNKIAKPTNPQRVAADAEYEFIGWFLGDEEWDFEADVVTGNITLTAHWKLLDAYTPPFLPKD